MILIGKNLIDEVLEDPAEGEDFSGFVMPKTKPGRTKLILENFENFKILIDNFL